MTKLVIVESPTKAKEVSHILGAGYIVKASFGHIRDLPLNEMGVEPPTFKPKYVPTDRGKKILSDLRDLVKRADVVYLASDPDREGEAIAWHLFDALNIPAAKAKRVTYNAITESAVREAFRNPRDINRDMVFAQEARRVLDRLVGYTISPALGRAGGQPLSAGRVQSVALRMIVERCRVIRSHAKQFHFGAELDFATSPGFTAEWDREKFANDEKLVLDRSIAEDASRVASVRVASVTPREEVRQPPAPFTTSTLAQAASAKLNLSNAETMKLAQELFEMGKCVTGDTLVTCSDGRLARIDDLHAEHSGSAGLELQGAYDLHSVRSVVSHYQRIPYAGKIIEMRTEDGNSLRMTPDHGMYILRDGQTGWVSAKNIQPGDAVATPFGGVADGTVERASSRYNYTLLELLVDLGVTDVSVQFDTQSNFFQSIIPIIQERVENASTVYKYTRKGRIPLFLLKDWGCDLVRAADAAEFVLDRKGSANAFPLIPLNANWWYLCGLILGSGSISKSRITLCESEECPVTEVLDRVVPFLPRTKYQFAHSKVEAVVFNQSLLTKIFGAMGLRTGSLWPALFSLPKNQVWAFVSGLFDGRGHFPSLARAKPGKLRATMTHKQRAPLLAIKLWMAHQGVWSTISDETETAPAALSVHPASVECFLAHTEKHLNFHQELAQVRELLVQDLVSPVDRIPAKGLTGEESALLRLTREQLQEEIDAPEDVIAQRLRLASMQVAWVEVVSLEASDFEGEVYDFTTSTENFIANGMLSHNCTYHRTDAVNISPEGLENIRSYAANRSLPLPKQPILHKSKVANAQEAHECVRPTDMFDTGAGLSGKLKELYQLMHTQTLLCQLSPARLATVTVNLEATESVNGRKHTYKARSVKVIEPGFTALSDKFEERVLPALQAGQTLNAADGRVLELETRPPSYYTEGTLTKDLEKRGIGRPSTYAAIIENIKRRGYVSVVGKQLQATQLGDALVSTLRPDDKSGCGFMEYEYTAKLEEQLDEISRGETRYIAVVSDVHTELAKDVELCRQNATRFKLTDAQSVRYDSGKGGSRSKSSSTRSTGTRSKSGARSTSSSAKPASRGSAATKKCSQCGNDMVKRPGKFGDFWGCRGFPNCRHTEKA